VEASYSLHQGKDHFHQMMSSAAPDGWTLSVALKVTMAWKGRRSLERTQRSRSYSVEKEVCSTLACLAPLVPSIHQCGSLWRFHSTSALLWDRLWVVSGKTRQVLHRKLASFLYAEVVEKKKHWHLLLLLLPQQL